MNALGIYGHTTEATRRRRVREVIGGWFWPSSYEGAIRKRDIASDVVFGIALPLFCFAIDPFVFRGWGNNRGVLEGIQLFTYVVVALEMSALVVWHVFGRRATLAAQWLSALGAIMLAGALFCLGIGIVLLPFSLLGLLFLIGVCGLTPFFTARIYLRNGLRAVSLAGAGETKFSSFAGATALGMVFVLGTAGAAQWSVVHVVSESVAAVVGGKELSWAETQSLKAASYLVEAEFVPLVSAYGAERDAVKRARLAKTYKELMGEDIRETWQRGS